MKGVPLRYLNDADLSLLVDDGISLLSRGSSYPNALGRFGELSEISKHHSISEAACSRRAVRLCITGLD